MVEVRECGGKREGKRGVGRGEGNVGVKGIGERGLWGAGGDGRGEKVGGEGEKGWGGWR